MSWAPYFHPSGDYIVFATSLQGFRNFELYIVDAAGAREPVRVTYSDGFDGLPVFSPDGARLSWSSSRTPDKKPQIFIADWNDAEARRLLGLDGTEPAGTPLLAAPPPGRSDTKLRAACETNLPLVTLGQAMQTQNSEQNAGSQLCPRTFVFEPRIRDAEGTRVLPSSYLRLSVEDCPGHPLSPRILDLAEGLLQANAPHNAIIAWSLSGPTQSRHLEPMTGTPSGIAGSFSVM